MDKFSSRSKHNKSSSRSAESGKVSSLPLPAKTQNDPTSENDSQQEELEKDLELLARLREQIEQLPDIDAAKIVQLHDKILSGEYQINSTSLADKLSDFESDL
ncbi:MAG: flagellar biosynthesis anti-sigma factor FlgM [Gammaproteobacteria bacterium]|nr:flagellar biosynthesis anti-sigma factor FlgM [Gammaproteobacteria bacterium]